MAAAAALTPMNPFAAAAATTTTTTSTTTATTPPPTLSILCLPLFFFAQMSASPLGQEVNRLLETLDHHVQLRASEVIPFKRSSLRFCVIYVC